MATVDVQAFNQILSTQTYFEGLRDFMSNEYAEENILFWGACDAFEKLDAADDLVRPAQRIFSLYLGQAAIFQIEVPADEVKKVFFAIQTKSVKLDIFAKCKELVADEMRRTVFPRFTALPTYHFLRPKGQGPEAKAEGDRKDPAQAIKYSKTLQRSFALAALASKTGPSLAEEFYEELYRQSPESRLMFRHHLQQQGLALQGTLTNLLDFIQKDAKGFQSQIKRLADVHLKLGITPDMFAIFGSVLTTTILGHLELEETSLEYRAVQRHWKALYALLSGEILKSMKAGGIKSSIFAIRNKKEVPLWLHGQLQEYKTYTNLALLLMKSRGNEEFVTAFYAKFFEFSPTSAGKFKDLSTQSHALWGSLNSVVKLLEAPNKMKQLLADLAKLHKGKGITREEYYMFVRALRVTFRVRLGDDYSQPMDAVWKQFLELAVLFLTESDEIDCTFPSVPYTSLLPKDQRQSTTPDESSHSSENETRNMDEELTRMTLTRSPSRKNNRLLDLAFFSRRLPGVPEATLQVEVQKLNDQLIYSSKQLECFSLAEVETFVAPATAKVLERYLRQTP